MAQGWEGWDDYAPFYDWENARTLGRRDVAFWRRVAAGAPGRVLELGSGTGRVSLPLARAGVDLVGIDRSGAMLDRARRKASRLAKRIPASRIPRIPRIPNPKTRIPTFVRGDIRALPFADAEFSMVLAPYGILQSLTRDRDLAATLESVARVLAPGCLFGIDLVPDVPNWREYTNQIQMRGKAAGGAYLTLVESVRQDRARRLTIFEQQYLVRRDGRTAQHRFELTFRTLSVRQMTARLERAGFRVDAVLGDYRGRPWDERAEVWLVLARRAVW